MKLSLKVQYAFLIITAFIMQVSCSQDHLLHDKIEINYSDKENWAYFIENDVNGVDVFFVAPTVF